MKKSLLILFLFFATFASGLGFIYFASTPNETITSNPTNLIVAQARNLVESPIDRYYASSETKTETLAAVGKSDSRPVIVDNFLTKHNSPMKGLGGVFVGNADKYGLDYRLLPAIAFQESTLGKKIPRGSHNAWGWAIYTGTNSGAKFKDWAHAIEIVAKGLKTDYIDRGLTTPEAIMTRYSDSEGSWAFGVNFAINEMTPK